MSPKINVRLDDVSTQFIPAPPGEYQCKVERVEDKSSNGRPAFQIMSVIDEPGNEEHGKPIFDYISLTTKNGDDNKLGRAQLKGYVEAILGEDRANQVPLDLDTDELLGGRFLGDVIINSYEKDGKTLQGNKFRKIQSL